MTSSSADAPERKYWYRFDSMRYAPPLDEFETPMGIGRLDVKLWRHLVLRTTPKGVWIDAPSGRRFILRDAHRRYACPTIEEARESFYARKRRAVAIMQRRIVDAEEAVALLKNDRYTKTFS